MQVSIARWACTGAARTYVTRRAGLRAPSGCARLKRIVKYPALESESKTAVAEKGEAQRSVATDSVQPVVGAFGDLTDSVGAEVSELMRFDASPHLFSWIEVRRVAR